MLIKQRISTGEYMFIEFDKEYESEEEAYLEHARLQEKWLYPGLPDREWAKVRNNLFKTGECDPEDIEQMNKSQRYVVNQFKLALRSLTKE